MFVAASPVPRKCADLAPHSAGLTAIAGSEAAPLARLASSLVVEFRG